MTKILFMGTPDFSVPILKRLVDDGYNVIGVVTQPDRPVGRKRVLTPPPVKVEALKLGLPVIQPEKLRGSEELEQVIELNADLIVTAAFGQILPKRLLEAPRFGCINVHASLLPELRGGAPIHYALLEGKQKTGITIMYMAEKLDAGNIISQAELPIEENDDVGTLHHKLSAVGADLLSATIPDLLSGDAESIPQDEEQATYAYNIKREQERINWSRTGEEIFNQIRGLSPWPVAYTSWNGSALKIWKAVKIPLEKSASPGMVIAAGSEGLIIGTGNETGISILEIQPAGKKKMPVEQFLRGSGLQMKKGDCLDEQR